MTLVKFYNNWKTHIEKKLDSLEFPQVVIFANLCCERLLPNYEFFAREKEFGSPSLLREIIERIWYYLEFNLSASNIEIEGYLNKLISPDVNPDSSESMHANWAQDSLIVIYDLLKYIQKKDINLPVNISCTCIDTVRKYIYETKGFIESDDPLFESKLVDFQVMKNEIYIQKKYLEFLNNIDVNQKNIIPNMRNQFKIEKSNIGLN